MTSTTTEDRATCVRPGDCPTCEAGNDCSLLAPAERFPIGSTASTVVHSIGGRSELVTGVVTELHYGRKNPARLCSVYLQTEAHGVLAVEPSKVQS